MAYLGVPTIVHEVAKHYRVTAKEILGKMRYPHIANARQVAMYLAHKFSGKSHTQIGDRFNRDRTTVLAAIDKVKSRISIEVGFAEQIEELEKSIAAAEEKPTTSIGPELFVAMLALIAFQKGETPPGVPATPPRCETRLGFASEPVTAAAGSKPALPAPIPAPALIHASPAMARGEAASHRPAGLLPTVYLPSRKALLS